MPKSVSPFPFFLVFWGRGVGKIKVAWGGLKEKMKATQEGVQNSYMDYYKFFRPTPSDKYWLVPK